MVGDEKVLRGGAHSLDDPVTGTQSTQPQQNQQEGSRANSDWELTQAEMISPLKSVEALMWGKMQLSLCSSLSWTVGMIIHT